MSPPPDIDALSPAELKSLVLRLFEEAAELRRMVAALRDEIARLKGGPGRPDIKATVRPSGMEKASEPQPTDPRGGRRRGGTRAKLVIDEERKLEVDAPPRSRFKGYASYLVQDLMIRPQVTCFRRQCWRTPDGKTVIAPLPPGVDGHFGPELRRFVLAQYHQGQVTAARLVTLLRGFGVVISKRQVVRLLIAGPGSPRRAAGRLDQRGLGHGRRHRGAPQGQERVLHPDRQRRFHLVPGPRARKAVSTSSSCCAPDMAITSSMTKPCPTATTMPNRDFSAERGRLSRPCRFARIFAETLNVSHGHALRRRCGLPTARASLS